MRGIQSHLKTATLQTVRNANINRTVPRQGPSPPRDKRRPFILPSHLAPQNPKPPNEANEAAE